MGSEGDLGRLYFCETLSVQIAFKGQNCSRMRARAWPGKLAPSGGRPVWASVYRRFAYFFDFFFSLILRLSSFLHDPIEYDATGRPTTTALFPKKLMLTLAFWSSLMLAHAFWSSLGFFLPPCGRTPFFKSFFLCSLFAFFVLFCVALPYSRGVAMRVHYRGCSDCRPGGLRGPPVGNPVSSSFQMCFDDRGVVLSTPVFAGYQGCLTYFLGAKKVSVFGG